LPTVNTQPIRRAGPAQLIQTAASTCSVVLFEVLTSGATKMPEATVVRLIFCPPCPPSAAGKIPPTPSRFHREPKALIDFRPNPPSAPGQSRAADKWVASTVVRPSCARRQTYSAAVGRLDDPVSCSTSVTWSHEIAKRSLRLPIARCCLLVSPAAHLDRWSVRK